MSAEKHSPGKIFLADDRGFFEDETHRRYSTFNFGDYQQPHKEAFGRLRTLNDEIIPAGGKLRETTTVNGCLLIIPIVGGVALLCQGDHYEIEAGQALLYPTTKGMEFELINPFQDDWVNFLLVEIQAEIKIVAKVFSFDIENTENKMLPVVNYIDLTFELHIGRFGGREEMLHQVKPGNSAFAFVIGGAFECQNRLLHERDALALWDLSDLDAEALSNGAVILLLELFGDMH